MNESRSYMPQKTLAWPVWLFVAGSLCLDVLFPRLIASLEGGPDNWLVVILALGLAGAIGGQICFVVVLAALSRRTWFGGLLLGSLLLAVGGSLIGIGLLLNGEMSDEDMLGFAMIGLVPGLLLAAAGPLYLFRHFAGWRLVRGSNGGTPRQPLGLEGVFAFITVLAAVIVLLQAPQVIWEIESSEYWPSILIASAILFAVGLIVLPWYVRYGLGDCSAAHSVRMLGGLSVAVMVLLFGIAQCFYAWQATWSERFEGAPYIGGFVAGASGVFCFSLWTLRLAGYELIRQPKQVSPSDEQLVELRRQRRSTRWQIATAILVTMAVSVGLARLQSWRDMKDLQNVGLQQYAEGTGGGITIRGRHVVELRLAVRAGEQGLVLYRACSQLRTLHLENLPINDDGLAELQHFPRLASLTLENTNVTDAGLVHLRHLKHLETLELNGAKLTGRGLLDFPHGSSLTRLSLMGTRFGDEQGAVLESFPELRRLDLSSTRVTDQCLPHLAALPYLNNLTANNTNITARDFPLLTQLGKLELDQTQVHDESIAALSRLPLLWNLTLRNTKITNAALKDLGRIQSVRLLAVSGNDIDDTGVRELRHAQNLAVIHLENTRVTGSAFADWTTPALLSQLFLDRTLFDDAGVKQLVKLKPFKVLSLSGTQVTDACLADITTMGIDKLDLSDTQVTVKGIRANGLRSVTELTLSDVQLQGIDLQLLEKQLGVELKPKERDEP